MSNDTEMTENHATLAELEAGLDDVRQAPPNEGEVRMIARRPAMGEREVCEEASLDPVVGLVGDNWQTRGSRRTEDGSAHPEMQLTLMCTRVAQLVARSQDRWALAGDQIYVDMDLSAANLPPGTRLAVGSAVIEITAVPHTGCKKFVSRFGVEAMKFVNSPVGRELQLRGVNARIVQAGSFRVGDTVLKVAP